MDSTPLTAEERFALLRGRGVAEESCTEDDEKLLRLLREKPNPDCYDIFEPSARMSMAQAFGKAIHVKNMLDIGCRVKIVMADWLAMLDEKIGGNLSKIQTAGRYMIEVWKALAMDLDAVEVIWSSEEINKRAHEFWPLAMHIARHNSVESLCQIMGSSKRDELTAAQSCIYPVMLCAHIFFFKVDICQMSTDQRDMNVLATKFCESSGRNDKPIILSHHMLPGFKEGQPSISTSDPSSAIFMDDNEAQVNLKIKRAFCPPKIVEGNPCLEYINHIVFPMCGRFEVIRKEANGGNKTYVGMKELLVDYGSGALHPGDVKPALAKAMNQILQPVRDHFNNSSEAKGLLNTVKKYM